MLSRIVLMLTLFSMVGCATFSSKSMGELESGYTYVPIDPFPVQIVSGDSCRGSETDGNAHNVNKEKPLLECLPDNAVRMLIEKFNVSGSVTYGSGKIKSSGESYRVTVDYINADTINVPVWITKIMTSIKSGDDEYVSIMSVPDTSSYIVGSETYTVTRQEPSVNDTTPYLQFNIPVYVGIGLRVAANVDVIDASASLSGIGVIGAEAEFGKLKGSLVVQTLGVNGKSITAALPIQSELNRTTAQNAIVAVGSIKALLYADETVKSPRVVGLYLPFPGGKPLVNAIISELSKKRVEWRRPCKLVSEKAPST